MDDSGIRKSQEDSARINKFYQRDPALVWAIIVGFVAAWLYVAPIAFNAGALGVLYRITSTASQTGWVWTWSRSFRRRSRPGQ